MLQIRRWASMPARRNTSNIRAKLQHFINTGEIQEVTPQQAAANLQRKNRRVAADAAKNTLSPQKALLLLRAKYDSALLKRRLSAQPIDLEKLRPSDLNVASDKSLAIFESLMEIKRISKKKIPPKLILHLLGITPEVLLDPFKITEETLKLLERDQNTVRAMELCHLGRGNAVVALNAVIQWCMEHGKVDMALKALHDRKRWMIPLNEQTHVLYFDGLAKNYSWDGVSHSKAQEILQIYSRVKRPLVQVFNACLLVLMKCFSNGQQLALDFFETAEESKTVWPDCQTFTIFLNGRKHYIQNKVTRIKSAPDISASERTKQLFAAQAELVETAVNVYEKVRALAMPPVPPTKEEAEANPEKLENYRKEISKVLMDIDPVFATTFLLCFINNFSGTAVTAKSGSHYQYMLHGLEFLKMWCPEVELMLHFALENHETKIIVPASDIKRRTDERVDDAEIPEKDRPLTHVKELSRDEVNPLVVFPPPPFSNNKTRAIFSNKRKRLVDFSRPKFSDVHKLLMHQTYVNLEGKFGKKLPLLQHISLEKGIGVNTFLLALAFESLSKIGAVKEFYLAMWYALTKWGGIYISRTDLKRCTAEGLTCGALPKSQYPDLTRVRDENDKFVVKECLLGDGSASEDSGEFNKLSFNEKMSLTGRHESSVVDVMLVENFIYKIDENFPKRNVPARFVTELLAAIVSPASNLSKSLKPREKTFDSVFAVLKRDLYAYNDKNLHKGTVSNRRRKVPNNTPKSSLTTEQLHDSLDSLTTLVRCIMVAESREYGLHKNRQSLMLNKFVESYDGLIKHIKSATWTDAPDNHENALEVHKKILGSGILFYVPKELYDPRKNIANATAVEDSVRYVYGKLKDREDLDEKLKKLMLALKTFIQLDPEVSDAAEKLKAHQWRIYNACK
uniref:Mitochondrial 15S rRNA processing factor CCM1 n=1 Tax=Candidozyma auris TaxID=498019 RepID=A0A0L0P7D1_CANAR